MALTKYVRFIGPENIANKHNLTLNGGYCQVRFFDDYVFIENDNGNEVKLSKQYFKHAKKATYINHRNYLKNSKKIKEAGLIKIKKGRGKSLYKCQKCNSTFWTKSRNIRKIPVCRNCSMGQSFGENAVIEYLTKKNINYEKEKTFKKLKGLGGKNLRFDFSIRKNDGSFFLIEIDGQQHNLNGDWGGNTKEHDHMKDYYCLENNITLHRIEYEFGKLEKLIKNLELVLLKEKIIDEDLLDENIDISKRNLAKHQNKSINSNKKAKNKKSKSKKKFYAIIKGRKSNLIVDSWGKCSALVTGYNGAQFKSFKNKEDALKYLSN